MTEAQLIEACGRGASYAQRLLFERFFDPLFVVCIRYIPVRADTEEALPDTFARYSGRRISLGTGGRVVMAYRGCSR